VQTGEPEAASQCQKLEPNGVFFITHACAATLGTAAV
jgi:hypothetical protein